jgi:predicted phage terminase large subunit-like protein
MHATAQVEYTPEQVKKMREAAEIRAAIEVREKFYAFRRYMRPDMQWNWWTQVLALELQQFYLDLEAGKRPKMALMAPPQHGKSWAAQDFMAWIAGKNPDLKIIFASYSDELGVSANTNLQRVLKSERYQGVFPGTHIGAHGWTCNQSLIEFVERRGSFRNTTIEGAINGMELHLGVIDDPHKGRAEAMSKTTRDRTWAWFADDWGARFAANSGMLILMTRWHVDDLLGRYLEKFPDVKIVRFPAIAEENEYCDPTEPNRPTRRRGQALFPQVKPLSFLLERKAMMTETSWESEYQQHPIIMGGGMFPIDKLTTLPIFDRNEVRASVRYWDKAGTEGGEGAYTAGVLMHSMRNKTYVIGHVVRGRWGALEREEQIKAWAQIDRDAWGWGYEIYVEQEPGSGGKESAEATIRELRGFRVFGDRVTGSKEVRAEPFAAQVQGGNVRLLAGPWQGDLLAELEAFPNGKYKDQVDACSGAFAKLTGDGYYNIDALAS